MPATRSRPLPDTYFALVRRFPLVVLATDADLADALSRVDDLLTQDLDAGGEAYLATLSALVRAYEGEHHPTPDSTPAEVLRELADANELTAAGLAQRSGLAPSAVSALMAGRRRPTPEQMTALATVFGIPASVFLPAVATGRREKPQVSKAARGG